jgi:hypothetical protein
MKCACFSQLVNWGINFVLFPFFRISAESYVQ